MHAAIPLREFYYLRHGQTDANAQGLMCGGDWDLELNELGREQAEAAAVIYKKVAENISKIICSPLVRARATAEIVNRQLGLPIEEKPELREWMMGDWGSRPYSEVKDHFLGEGEPPNGETRKTFGSRVQRGLAESLQSSERPVLLVAHGGVWLAIAGILGLEKFRSENAIPFRVWPDSGQWKVEKL